MKNGKYFHLKEANRGNCFSCQAAPEASSRGSSIPGFAFNSSANRPDWLQRTNSSFKQAHLKYRPSITLLSFRGWRIHRASGDVCGRYAHMANYTICAPPEESAQDLTK